MAGRSVPGVALPSRSKAAAEVRQLRAELELLREELDDHKRVNAILGDAVEQFVGALTHDLKNPLAAIKVNVQGLKRTLERGTAVDSGYWVERLGRIDKAIEQVQEGIAAARTRLSSDAVPRQPLRRAALDLVSLAREVLEPYCRAGQRRIRLESACAVLAGSWDEGRLRQAIEALLDNAVKFSPQGKPITLAIERDAAGAAAVIRCRDYGIGIPARDLPRVCDRLYRGENVLGRYKGAGLGLFEAHRAITDHGGELTIDSVEGSGSVVTVILPLG